MLESCKKSFEPNYAQRVIKTQIVAILNCTPDSYHAPSRFTDHNRAIERALELIEEGADIVDIGGESTRPGAEKVNESDELSRVIPVIAGVRKYTDLPLSIDTYKPKVAEAALQAGATILNDITGFTNPKMRQIAAASGATVIVMHMKGPPHSCPELIYKNGVEKEVKSFLSSQAALLIEEDIDASKIILDPGFGGGSFGKNVKQSLALLRHLPDIQQLGFPLLVGLSRKSFLQKILKKDASQVLSTTLAVHTMAALAGVAYIRVHDVEQHRDILTFLDHLVD